MLASKYLKLMSTAAVIALLLPGCSRAPSSETEAAPAAAPTIQVSKTPPTPETAQTEAPPAARPEEAVPPPEPLPTSARIANAEITKTAFLKADPDLQEQFDEAYGYAIFPSIVKGALIVGGAGGEGVVYEQGRPIGYSTMTQGTIGLAAGGQEYSELIFFETAADLADFTGGSAKFSAQASAVAATAGGAANANYRNGVLIFTMAKGGLMLEASVGGQGFSFERLP